MTDLRELYQELIIDHGRHPRNFKELVGANFTKDGFNPLCGDRLTVYFRTEGEIISEVCFQGSGCAISMASASLMTESLKGKTVAQAKKLFEAFHNTVMGVSIPDETVLGKLLVLKGVADYPARVKCATLAWHTAMGAISGTQDSISTE